MAMTVAVKEADLVVAAIAKTFPYCNTSITEDIGNSITDIFSSVLVYLFSLKNHSIKPTPPYTPTKNLPVTQQVEK